MSCGCNGSSSTSLNNGFTVNNGYTQAVVNPLNSGYPLNNGYTQVVNPLNSGYPLNNGFAQSAINPLNSGYPLNTNFTQAANNGFTTAANCSSSLLGATYTTLSPLEQSYTYNPQITSTIRPVSLSTTTANYIPSVSVPLLSSQAGFVNYYVRSSPTYLNNCN